MTSAADNHAASHGSTGLQSTLPLPVAGHRARRKPRHNVTLGGELVNSGEELVRLCPSSALHTLGFLSLVRCATAGQTARFTTNGDAAQARKVLNYLLGERLVGVVRNVRLPTGGGRHRSKKKDTCSIASAYYLTHAGCDSLATESSELARRAHPGRLSRTRVPHALLVAEAYLWYEERFRATHVVQDFQPEEELRRIKIETIWAQAERREFGRARELSRDAERASLPDFRIFLHERDSNNYFWEDAEVDNGMTVARICAKPQIHRWFTPYPKQARSILYHRRVKNDSVVILDDVRAPLTAEYADSVEVEAPELDLGEPSSESPREASKELLLEVIDRLGGAADARTLALVVGKSRAFVSELLNEMFAEYLLWQFSASLRPGKTCGRPATFYGGEWLASTEVFERAEIALRCAGAAFLLEEGYKLSGFVASETAGYRVEYLSFCHEVESDLRLIADNGGGKSDDELIVEIEEAGNTPPDFTRIAVAVAEPDRLRFLRQRAGEEVVILDFGAGKRRTRDLILLRSRAELTTDAHYKERLGECFDSAFGRSQE